MKYVRNKNDLRQSIHEEMQQRGPACNLNHLDISRLNDLSFLFQTFPTFCGDISEWDTSNVRSMECLFDSCHFNGDLSKWNTSKVTNMSGMFTHSKFNGDISQWDVSNVTDMDSMFLESQFNGDLSLWNTGKVQTMSKMFAKSRFDGDLSHWNVSEVVDMTGMFWKSEFEGEISNWNTSKVTTMNYMFQNSVFRGDISKWPLDSLEEYLRVFSQWHASPLGIASYIDSRETVLGALPAAFEQLLRITEQLGMDGLDAAKHLYQMLYLEPPALSTPSWSNFLLED